MGDFLDDLPTVAFSGDGVGPKFIANTVGGEPQTYSSNALSMSLLSGPQTIEVTANLAFSYETPLDGKVIIDRKE